MHTVKLTVPANDSATPSQDTRWCHAASAPRAEGGLLLISAALAMLLLGCGSSSPGVNWVASVATDDDSTSVQLVKLVDEGGEAPVVEEVGVWYLDYGAMKFALNQGSVPGSTSGLPASCEAGTSLGEDDAGPCVFRPMLGAFASTLSDNGIQKEDVAVLLSYGTSDNEAYTLDVVEGFDDVVKNFVSSELGFNVGDKEAEGLGKYDLEGYLHDDSIARSDQDWLGKLPDSRKFSNLSLPGTHDTISLRGPTDYGKTQTLDLNKQINAGIRAFDVRVRCVENRLEGYHGDYSQYITFDTILYTMWQFLDAHPREAFFVRVKNEAGDYKCAGGKTFQSIFNDRYFQTYRHIWKPTGTTDPTLEEVRSSIVFLQDFDQGGYPLFGLEYPSSRCQDHWYLDGNWELWDKWANYVKPELERARSQPSSATPKLSCNFLSGSFDRERKNKPVFPYFVASGHSSPGTQAPRLWTGLCGAKSKMASKYPDFEHRYYGSKALPQASIWFTGTNDLAMQWLRNNHPRYAGIIFADFPGKDLIGEIINANFR